MMLRIAAVRMEIVGVLYEFIDRGFEIGDEMEPENNTMILV